MNRSKGIVLLSFFHSCGRKENGTTAVQTTTFTIHSTVLHIRYREKRCTTSLHSGGSILFNLKSMFFDKMLFLNHSINKL